MHRLFGIETEYGIAVEGKGAGDMIEESIALVRAYSGTHARGWNYRGEDSRRDMRGFVADRLSTNPDDAQFDVPGKSYGSVSEERSDRILGNGARLYNDHGHPEYSTPECSDLKSLVAHDRAGERIVWECAQARMDTIGHPISIYKNNTDFHGSSYGTHECVLMNRSIPTQDLIRGLTPFLVTRQIFVGAGKVGVEVDRAEPLYQLSQRADFFSVEASVDTLHNRPIVNTRAEPHATPSKYRRLHVIIGDANMCEWATAMKMGTLSVIVQLLESGWTPSFDLKNPCTTLKSISRDPTFKWNCFQTDGYSLTAVDVQRRYLAAAKERLTGESEDTNWVLSEWEKVLEDLAKDPTMVVDRVDWAAKRQLLQQFMENEGLTWKDPIMQSLDLAYHDVDPETGLYFGLEQAGEMRRIVSDARIDAAICNPPMETRAYLRGQFVKKFSPSIKSISWNGVMFEHGGEDMLFDMNPLVEENVSFLNREFSKVTTLSEAVECISMKPEISPN